MSIAIYRKALLSTSDTPIETRFGLALFVLYSLGPPFKPSANSDLAIPVARKLAVKLGRDPQKHRSEESEVAYMKRALAGCENPPRSHGTMFTLMSVAHIQPRPSVSSPNATSRASRGTLTTMLNGRHWCRAAEAYSASHTIK